MMDVWQLSNLCVVALVFVYSLNLTPMVFESFTSDRIWAANPPDSFSMFVGRYGHKTAHYWRVVSPLAVVCFVLSVFVNWGASDRTVRLSIAFVVYLAVQISTMAYFVPEQEGLIARADSLSREELKRRADRWIALNNFRIAAGVVAFIFLLAAVLAPRVP